MSAPTVSDDVAAYVAWADGYYRRADGSPTRHVGNVKYAVAPLVELFGSADLATLKATDFRAVQARFIDAGLCRVTVNARMKLVRHFVRWAVSWDRGCPELLLRCSSVPGLRRGRTPARESSGIRPVAWATVAATLPHLVPQLRAAVLVHWWTGARVGEVLSMRAEHLRRAGPVVVYSPPVHKTAHHGHDRTVLLGPQAVAALPSVPAGLLFRTATGRAYTSLGYRLSIVRACDRACIERWTPLQIRHSAATRFRAALGIEATRVLLGHRSAVTSEIYAERDLAGAMRHAELVA